MLSEQYRVGNEITLDQVLHAREDIQDFRLFCDMFLSNVIGKNEYNKKVGHTPISSMSSVGDEAFAIVCVENSIDRWKEEAEDPDKKNRLNWQPTKYTANPSESSKHGGWSLEGIRRFNSLSRIDVPEMRKLTVDMEKLYVQQENVARSKTKVLKMSKMTSSGGADESYLDPLMYENETDVPEQHNGDGVFPKKVGV